MDNNQNNAKVPESFRKIQTDHYELPRFIVSQMSISLRKSYGIYYNQERNASQRLIVLSQIKDKNNDDKC